MLNLRNLKVKMAQGHRSAAYLAVRVLQMFRVHLALLDLQVDQLVPVDPVLPVVLALPGRRVALWVRAILVLRVCKSQQCVCVCVCVRPK